MVIAADPCHPYQATVNPYIKEVSDYVEEIILGNRFKDLHLSFLENFFQYFAADQAGNPSGVIAFREYALVFEEFFFYELLMRMPNFTLQRFEMEMARDTSTGGYFNHPATHALLQTFVNYFEFRDMMMRYRIHRQLFLHPPTNSSLMNVAQNNNANDDDSDGNADGDADEDADADDDNELDGGDEGDAMEANLMAEE